MKPRKHPNEQELQRFAGRSGGEPTVRRIQEHVDVCDNCRHKAKVYDDLNRQLNALAHAHPSPDFTDRVMERLAAEPSQQGRQDSKAGTFVRQPWWRPELTNLLAATAATYLFIHLGILQQVISLDAGVLESGLRGKVGFVIGFVDKVTHHIR